MLGLDSSELLELELDPGSSNLPESVQGRGSSVRLESVPRRRQRDREARNLVRYPRRASGNLFCRRTCV